MRREKSRAADIADQLRITGLQELNDRPNSNVLEGGIWAGQKTEQIVVHSTLGLVPDLVEGGVVVGGSSPILGREVSEGSGAISLDFGTKGIGQRDQNLANSHLQQLSLEFI